MSANKDSVYHLTALSNLESIEQIGLQPNPEYDDLEMRKLVDEAADLARTPELVAAGISRQGAIYAYPLLEKVHGYSLGARRATAKGERSIALEISVDPDKTLVVDASMLDKLAKTLWSEQQTGQTEESRQKVERSAQAYWKAAVTLSDYRTLYDADTRTRIDKDFDSPLPYHIATPEVLVPGPVEPTEITWAASMLVDAVAK